MLSHVEIPYLNLKERGHAVRLILDKAKEAIPEDSPIPLLVGEQRLRHESWLATSLFSGLTPMLRCIPASLRWAVRLTFDASLYSLRDLFATPSPRNPNPVKSYLRKLVEAFIGWSFEYIIVYKPSLLRSLGGMKTRFASLAYEKPLWAMPGSILSPGLILLDHLSLQWSGLSFRKEGWDGKSLGPYRRKGSPAWNSGWPSHLCPDAISSSNYRPVGSA